MRDGILHATLITMLINRNTLDSHASKGIRIINNTLHKADTTRFMRLQWVDRADYRLKNVSMVIGRFKRPLLGLIRDWNFTFFGGGFREPSDIE